MIQNMFQEDEKSSKKQITIPENRPKRTEVTQLTPITSFQLKANNEKEKPLKDLSVKAHNKAENLAFS